MVPATSNRTSVLDHGYVELVEAWGSDERIVESARMSTSKGFEGWGEAQHHEKCPDYGDTLPRYPKKCKHCLLYAGDERLLQHLYTHKHSSPFEQCGLTFEVQAPIIVFREWHRHRTQSYNEMSGRYTVLPDLFYVPSLERIEASAKVSANKQASGGGALKDDASLLQARIANCQRESRLVYEHLLEMGIAKEIARVVLPVSQYSKMRASANLRNWLAFLALRLAPDAQWEIRQYAIVVGRIVADKFPRVWGLLEKEPYSAIQERGEP